ESPCHFVQVGCEMLCRDAMPCPNDAALEQAECGLYGVRVDVRSESDILFCAVVDGFVLGAWDSSFVHRIRIRGELIGHDHIHVTAYVLFDVLRQCAGLRILSMEEPEIAAALTDANYNLFCFLACVNAPADL